MEGLAEPCLRRGTLRDLLDQMMSLDSTLNQWDGYLMALCRYLSAKRLHSSLYHLQVFMRVSIMVNTVGTPGSLCNCSIKFIAPLHVAKEPILFYMSSR